MGEALHGLRVALLSAVVGAEVSAISAWEMASSAHRVGNRDTGARELCRLVDGTIYETRCVSRDESQVDGTIYETDPRPH